VFAVIKSVSAVITIDRRFVKTVFEIEYPITAGL